MSKKNDFTKFFFQQEVNILAEYLGRQDDIPADMRNPDAIHSVPDDWDEATQGIGVREGSSDASQNADEFALANAVARICLSNVQENLPQWASFTDDELKLARTVKPQDELPSRILLPQHLFTIDWANTAPGLCWPEAYYVTHLPGWDVHVVTASQDSDEIYGYEDFAIGWFDGEADDVKGAKDVLINYWRNLHDEFDQQRWEELFGISSGDPEGWANEIWPSEGEEEVEDEPKKTLGDAYRNAGSALTVQFDEEEQGRIGGSKDNG